MATWAAKLASAGGTAGDKQQYNVTSDQTVAVIDANAIISLGVQARSLADVLVTTEEVIAEIRDAASREALNVLSVERRSPSDDAIRAVASFANRTGDFHQLSTEDMRLLALAYTLESEAYGIDHLRTDPVPVRSHAKAPTAGKLPGWGNSSPSEDWQAIDQVLDDAVSTATHGKADPEATEVAHPGTNDVDDTWEVAKKSRNAARRAKRKAAAKATMPGQLGMWRNSEDTSAPCVDECSDPLVDERNSESNIDGNGNTLGSELHSISEDADLEGNSKSRISLVTSDFPMQNVAIQMRLRLLSVGGEQIRTVQRFVLRCDACAAVVKSQSKLFCPACGHATLSRVCVAVGQDGAEYYGIRKRHTLKGTRFPLPKPRGGKGAKIPILSEDVYNSKMRKPRQKKDSDPLEDLTFGEYKKHSNHSHGIAKGLSYVIAGPRNNPNERKNMPRSNRRR